MLRKKSPRRLKPHTQCFYWLPPPDCMRVQLAAAVEPQQHQTLTGARTASKVQLLGNSSPKLTFLSSAELYFSTEDSCLTADSCQQLLKFQPKLSSLRMQHPACTCPSAHHLTFQPAKSRTHFSSASSLVRLLCNALIRF